MARIPDVVTDRTLPKTEAGREAALRSAASSLPWFVCVSGVSRSGISFMLSQVAHDIRENKPSYPTTVSVPAPFSLQALGVALARALDPDAPDKLDSARSDTAWNHARRHARGLYALVVDDVGNVPSDEMQGFTEALKSIASTSGAVVVMGGSTEAVDEAIETAAIRNCSTLVKLESLTDDEVLAFAVQVAAGIYHQLGEDITGSPDRIAAVALATEGRRGKVADMIRAAARRIPVSERGRPISYADMAVPEMYTLECDSRCALRDSDTDWEFEIRRS